MKQEANTGRVSQFQKQQFTALLKDLIARAGCAANNTSPQEDAEAVHQLRVAIRRVQVALVIEQKSIFAEEPYRSSLLTMRHELKRIMALAGEVRNRDITLAFVTQETAEQTGINAEYVGELSSAREKWRRKLAKRLRNSLDDGWFAQLAIPGTAVAPRPLEDQDSDDAELLRSASKTLRKAARSYFRRGRKAVRELRPSPAWHKFRLAAKRLRYSLDFFQTAWDLSGYGAQVREVQHHLGVINDAETILKLIGGLAIPKGDLRKFKATLREHTRPHLKNIRQIRDNLIRKERREWESEIGKTLARGLKASALP